MSGQADSHRPGSDKDQRDRKQQVLTHGTASSVHGISDALVIKDADLYFLCKPDGDVPVGGNHGFGLYYDDCRFLRGYELRLAGDLADRLASSARDGTGMSIELTNPELRTSDKERVPKERVGLTWRRDLDGHSLKLQDTLTFENFGMERAVFPVDLRFDACFEDVFAVRGLLDEQPGQHHDPAWHGHDLVFEYDGADGRDRRVTVSFDPAPSEQTGTQAGWTVELGRQQRKEIHVELAVNVREKHSSGDSDGRDRSAETHGKKAGANRRHESKPAAGGHFATVRSDSRLLEAILDRSFKDLQILRSYNAGAEYFAAGVPWFVALFGRDSVITSIEALAFDPSVAEQTLRVLAAWQGTKTDDYRDEQPGKILHELRVGELATIGAVPHHPFYGSVDSTPLFLLLMARYSRWTGKLDLFRELRSHLDAAMDWVDRYGDTDGDGFTDYRSSTGRGLVNQGWKDSGNAIVNADGSLATPPIALVEVQGYVFAAKRELADLYERDGDAERAATLRREAGDLRQRFEDRFWLGQEKTYALALQEGGRQVSVVSSNPGQALWTGIVSDGHAPGVRDSLMTDSMFSGWGIRTLSHDAVRFNPIGYHLGTVWPHDNAIIAAGLRRYGFDDEAERVAEGIVDAASQFAEHRLPEVFAGYPRSRFAIPVHYPVACHPQAWAAGAVPYLLTTMLGLEPNAFARELRVVRPMLFPFVDWLEVQGLRVGAAECDLRFERTTSGAVVEVTRLDGDLDVLVEPARHRDEDRRRNGRHAASDDDRIAGKAPTRERKSSAASAGPARR